MLEHCAGHGCDTLNMWPSHMFLSTASWSALEAPAVAQKVSISTSLVMCKMLGKCWETILVCNSPHVQMSTNPYIVSKSQFDTWETTLQQMEAPPCTAQDPAQQTELPRFLRLCQKSSFHFAFFVDDVQHGGATPHNLWFVNCGLPLGSCFFVGGNILCNRGFHGTRQDRFFIFFPFTLVKFKFHCSLRLGPFVTVGEILVTGARLFVFARERPTTKN